MESSFLIIRTSCEWVGKSGERWLERGNGAAGCRVLSEDHRNRLEHGVES